jgi:uncharacterized protein
MLKVDLAELIRTTGKHIVVEIDDVPSAVEDITFLSPAKGRVTITNSGSLVIVRGSIVTSIRMECGRCLCEVAEPITAEIDEQYTLSDVSSSGSHDSVATIVADEENEVPPGLMDGTVMDLAVVVRQAVILASPISTLCKENCRGMCPVCGKNRNIVENGCSCVQPKRNTPLAVLKDLLLDDIDSESDR